MGKNICGKGGFVIPANSCTLFSFCFCESGTTGVLVCQVRVADVCRHFVVGLLLPCCGMTSAFVFPVFHGELDSGVAQSASTVILVLCGSGECLPEGNHLCSASAPDGS